MTCRASRRGCSRASASISPFARGERDLDLRDRSGQPVDTLFDVDPTDASGSRRLYTPVQHGSSRLRQTPTSPRVPAIRPRIFPLSAIRQLNLGAHRLELDAARLAERLQGIGSTPRLNKRVNFFDRKIGREILLRDPSQHVFRLRENRIGRRRVGSVRASNPRRSALRSAPGRQPA